MGISLDGLSGMYSEYENMYGKKTTSDSLKTEIENNDYSNSTDEELMKVCKDFETYFTEQVFKALQKMVPESEESSSSTSSYMDYFGDNLIQEYAKSATEQNSGLGIAQMLFEQMKRNYSI